MCESTLCFPEVPGVKQFSVALGNSTSHTQDGILTHQFALGVSSLPSTLQNNVEKTENGENMLGYITTDLGNNECLHYWSSSCTITTKLKLYRPARACVHYVPFETDRKEMGKLRLRLPNKCQVDRTDCTAVCRQQKAAR